MFNTKVALVAALLAMTLAPLGLAQDEKSCTGSCSSCTTSTVAAPVMAVKKLPPPAGSCCPQEAPSAKTCTSGACEKTATIRVRLSAPQEDPNCCATCRKQGAAARKKPAASQGRFVVATRVAPTAAKKAAACSGDCEECEESCTVVESIALEDVADAPTMITFARAAGQEVPGCADCKSKGKRPAAVTSFGLAKQEAPGCSDCKCDCKGKGKKPARMAGRIIDMKDDAGGVFVFEGAPGKAEQVEAHRLLLRAMDFGGDSKAVDLSKAVDMTTDVLGRYTLAWTQEAPCPKCKTCPKCKKCTACDKCKKAGKPHGAALRQMIEAHHPDMTMLPPAILGHLDSFHQAHGAPDHAVDIQVYVNGKLVYGSDPHKAHGARDGKKKTVRWLPTASKKQVDALLRKVDDEETMKRKAEEILLKFRGMEKKVTVEKKKAMEVRKKAADARKKAAAARKKAAAKKKAVRVAESADLWVERIGIQGAAGKAQGQRRGTRTLKGSVVKPSRRAAGVILGGPKSSASKSEMEQLRKDIDDLRASLRKLTQEVRRLNRDR